MFVRIKGKTKNIYLPVTPSTALPARSLVTMSGGKLVAAVAGTAADDLFGVLIGEILATDDDYADDRRVAVEVPVEANVVYEFDTASLVATDIGNDVDLTDNLTVNRGATAIGVVRPVAVITTTLGRGYVKINGSY